MIKKQSLKKEFNRLVISEGYNCDEAIAMILIRYLEVILPLMLLFYVFIRQKSRIK